MGCCASCFRSSCRTRDSRKLEIIAPAVFYNENETAYYDMRGNKLLFIFCHENYMNSDHVKSPLSRNEARKNAELLKITFEKFEFRCRIYYDLTHAEIINIIKRVSQQDHTRTSCLFLAMITDSTSNGLLAADRPFSMKSIKMLLQTKELAGIVKMLLFPYTGAGNEGPENVDKIPSQIRQNVSHVDDGNTVRCAAGKTIVTASASDFLSITANNDQISISIVIQALCKVFNENQELGYGDLIPMINQMAANNADSAEVKVIAQAIVTLTKRLLFTRIDL